MVLAQIKQVEIPAADALELNDVVKIYQALLPNMPPGRMGVAKPASRLIDLLDEFDGLVLYGYGVINVGDGQIDGIATLLDAAASRDKPVLVLRERSERAEANEAGCIKIVGTKKENIVNEFNELILNKQHYKRMSEAPNPYGDGHSAKRILNILDRHFHA